MLILYSTQSYPKINVEERHVIVPPAAVVELKLYCSGGGGAWSTIDVKSKESKDYNQNTVFHMTVRKQ
jgi:hypothetical protein